MTDLLSPTTLPDANLSPELCMAWQPAWRLSLFLRRHLQSKPAIVADLAANWQQAFSREEMNARLAATCPPGSDDEQLKRALRQLRQAVMCRLIVRDTAAGATLGEVVETMTALADATTNFALSHVHCQLAELYGEPLKADGSPQRLMIVGMGKLGGRELNVSSDVDYIFVYPEEGETAGRADGTRRIDNYEFFTRLGRRLIAALGEATADGQVFRVDMRLRPNGDSGPLVCSLDTLENYFITQGREWERYAWIKGRLMNEGDNLTGIDPAALTQVVRPFIYRKYLDFGAINAMQDLHAQIRREVSRRDRADHIKLGPGGIREIEFVAQVFQLIRGGRDTALQIRPTCQVLGLLAERGQLAPEAVAELLPAYDFLRRLEHRLQYVDDQQTHSLPTEEVAQAHIALSMDFPDWAAFRTVLDGHRERVSGHFDAVFGDRDDSECKHQAPSNFTGIWQGDFDTDTAAQHLREAGFQDIPGTLDKIDRYRSGSRYRQLPSSNRERLDALAPRLLELAGKTPEPDTTVARGLELFEAIGGRGAYLALLQQYPQALHKVADLMCASSWAAEYLTRHPIVLDELLDPRLFEAANDWPTFRADLARRLADEGDDSERQMDILRETHHAQLFRLLVQDLAGIHSVEQISDHLTELADSLVAATIPQCWNKLSKRHRDTPRFAVIGYGKMGGKELGYASDLDLVFIYDDDDQSSPEIYNRLAQRMNTWLSSRTAAGTVYETDFRLRPNGDAGLLATSMPSFVQYQQENAWVWEHQALTRARFVAGDPAVGATFDRVREDILRQPRDLAKLREEVLAMRQKMLDNLASNSETEFDIKHDPGGIVDVEFIVQYLILAHAHQHPQLCANLGNIALLRIAAELGLIPAAMADPCRDAYREYRRQQHIKRLNGTPKARISRADQAERIAAVRALWQAVFGA